MLVTVVVAETVAVMVKLALPLAGTVPTVHTPVPLL